MGVFLKLPTVFLAMLGSFWGFFFQRMAEKCSQFLCILEREDREFEKAMREQVGTIFSSANGLYNVESF